MSEDTAGLEHKKIVIAVRGVIALIATLYFFTVASSQNLSSFLDSINNVLYEGGTIVASFFSENLNALFGSLFQVGVPFLLLTYLFLRRAKFAGAMVLFWFGESLVAVATSVLSIEVTNATAVAVSDRIVDWQVFLSTFSLEPKTALIGWVCYGCGVIVLVMASAASFWYSRLPRRRDLLIYTGAIVAHEGKILFAEERYEDEEALWAFPLGLVDHKEDVSAAARRIVAEKAGYTIGLSGVPSVVLTSGLNMRLAKEYALCPVRLYLFTGTVVGECNKREGAVLRTQWIEPKNIDELLLRAEWMRLFVHAVDHNGQGYHKES